MNLKKLKSIRIEKDYTQKDLAKYIGMSSKTYNRKELGIVEFNRKEIQEIAKVLNLSIQMVNKIFFENDLPKV
ncbi:MAG: helix-turn-helix transcriptional regulator [Firmicutes bacterium]|nr:helix-turn-helix transcriptional regulator [Bacillota bacterium]